MRNYIKYTCFLLLVLALLGVFLAPVVTVSAEQPQAIETVSQLVVNDPVSLEVVTEEITVLPLNATIPQVYHETIADAVEELRTKLKNREYPIVIGLKQLTYDPNTILEIVGSIFDEALLHTGVGKEGDYLRFHCGYRMQGIGDENLNISAGFVSDGKYFLNLVYKVNYYTSAQQEAEVDAAVATLLDQLDVWDKSDYEKVKAVYDYICNNVTYDHEGLEAHHQGSEDHTIFSAWKALTQGTSVCQGYANLFYRLMLELGVDCRFISGTGNGGAHAWNIVKLGGLYYNLDATWDAPRAAANVDYDYFLRSPGNFIDHIRDAEFETPDFHTQYPMGERDYAPGAELPPEAVAGDMNGDYQLSDADALYLLRYTLFPTRYPIAIDADVNSDGVVTDADALYLLRHTLFPTRYPLYPAA